MMGILIKFLPIIVLSLWAPALLSIGDVNMSAAFFACAFLSALAKRNIRLKVARRTDSFLIIGIVASTAYLFVFSLLSSSWAEDPFRTLRMAYAQFVGLAVIFLFLSSDANERASYSIVKYMFWGCVASSAVCVVAYYFPPLNNIFFADSDRTAAFFKQGNQLGIALSMAAPLIIAYPLSKGHGWIFVLAFAGLLFLGLAFSGSKTNLVLGAIAVSLSIFACMQIMQFPLKHPFATLVIIVATPIFIIAAIDILETVNPRAFRILQQFSEDGTAPSLDIRAEVWSDGIAEGMNHPLLGVGAGQMAFSGRFSHSHNVFIDYFRCLGVTGLVAVSIQISCIILLCISCLKDSILNGSGRKDLRIIISALAIGILSYATSNQMSDSFGPSTISLMWMFLGCMYMLRRIISLPPS